MIRSFIFILLWSRSLCSPERPSNWHGRLSTNTNAKQVAACGDDTTVDLNPWAAILYIDGKFRCGATILDHQLAVTAAHCVIGKRTHRMILYYGRTYQLDSTEEDTIYRDYGGRTKILSVRNHQDYDKFSPFKGNDISVLKLETFLEFGEYVRPIEVVPTHPKYQKMFADARKVQFAGFGQISGPLDSDNHDDYPVQMQLVENRIVPQETCNRGSDSARFGPPRDGVCTRGRCSQRNHLVEAKFKQACPGDSGSGIVQFFDEENKYYLLSVISFIITPNKEDCGHSSKPVLSINARDHRSFIYKDEFASSHVSSVSSSSSSSSVDCRWNQWSQWTECSKKCDGGRRSRSRRKVTEASNGGRTCVGDATDEEACNEQICQQPVDCRWEQWSRWSKCTEKCGGGRRSRSRSKLRNASNGGRTCVGDDKDEEACNEQICEKIAQTIAQTFRSCDLNEKCETRDTCEYVENKYQEIERNKEQKRRIVKELKSLICNKEEKAFCCPPDYGQCEVVSDCFKNANFRSPFLDNTPFRGYICENNQCKPSSGCGTNFGFPDNDYELTIGEDDDDEFVACSSCDAEGCEDEGVCSLRGGRCTGPETLNDVNCKDESDCFNNGATPFDVFSGYVCIRNQCKVSSGCGNYQRGAPGRLSGFKTCSSCDAEGCEDEGVCSLRGGRCTGPETLNDVHCKDASDCSGDGFIGPDIELICKNSKCKISSECGIYQSAPGRLPGFKACSSCNANDCEDKGVCSLRGGRCTGPETLNDIQCEDAFDCSINSNRNRPVFIGQDAEFICKNNKCKISSGCGDPERDIFIGGDEFVACSSCDADDCEDEGFCKLRGGKCTGPETKKEVPCVTKAKEPCMFPFIYKGELYNKCTFVDSKEPWCAIVRTVTGDTRSKSALVDSGEAGDCISYCEVESDQSCTLDADCSKPGKLCRTNRDISPLQLPGISDCVCRHGVCERKSGCGKVAKRNEPSFLTTPCEDCDSKLEGCADEGLCKVIGTRSGSKCVPK